MPPWRLLDAPAWASPFNYRVAIGMLFLLLCATASFASLSYIPARKLYDLSDLVFIGKLIRIENTSENIESALLKNLLTIKGEFSPEIHLCNEELHRGLGVVPIGDDKQVYFLKKKNGCHVGVLGYRSIIYTKKDTNCIFAEFAYPLDEHSYGKLEPLEVFVNKLVGKNAPSFPESLKAEQCEPLFKDH